jgi:hypothetical protein
LCCVRDAPRAGRALQLVGAAGERLQHQHRGGAAADGALGARAAGGKCVVVCGVCSKSRPARGGARQRHAHTPARGRTEAPRRRDGGGAEGRPRAGGRPKRRTSRRSSCSVCLRLARRDTTAHERGVHAWLPHAAAAPPAAAPAPRAGTDGARFC